MEAGVKQPALQGILAACEKHPFRKFGGEFRS
jgi:hypothetical protein